MCLIGLLVPQLTLLFDLVYYLLLLLIDDYYSVLRDGVQLDLPWTAMSSASRTVRQVRLAWHDVRHPVRKTLFWPLTHKSCVGKFYLGIPSLCLHSTVFFVVPPITRCFIE
jgi:hypothetical protein